MPSKRRTFNCAAPFRGRLRDEQRCQHDPYKAFNCAAPFRGRLPGCGIILILSAQVPSIVPPPSGGGYSSPGSPELLTPGPSIVPPPSGGGYNLAVASNDRPAHPFNCAAPFRGRLLAAAIDALTGRTTPSIVPPPSGGGYAPRPQRDGQCPDPPFNCAAPFRGPVTRHKPE